MNDMAPMWRERTLWLLLAFVALMGTVFMPREMYPGDPVTVREETRAILLHRELAVEPRVATHYGETQERGQYVVENPNNGRSYSKYGSMLAVAYVLPMAVEWFVEGELPVFSSPRRPLYLNGFNILLTLLTAASLYRTARRFGTQAWVSAVFVSLCFYTTYLWNYLRAQNSDIFQLLLFCWAFSAFLDVVDARARGTTSWALARMWLACAALMLTKTSYVFVGPIFASALFVDRASRGFGSLVASAWAEARLHAMPAVLAAGVLAIHNWIKFGAPWASGYHVWRPHIVNPFAGDLPQALFELCFSARWGVPALFPVLLLAIPWIVPWARREPIRYGAVVAIAGFYTLFLGSVISWRGEMAYGPRYWIFVLPLLVLPAVDTIAWLARRNWTSRLTLVAVIVLLGASIRDQLAVNRHSFFAAYYVLGPLENHMTVEAAEFFVDHSFGYVLRHLERAFPELAWWQNMQPKISPDAAGAYENHVRTVLGQGNLYWFQR